MKRLTIRNVPSRLAAALDRERRRCGQSLNQTVISLLAQALGLGPGTKRSNGLARLAGTWSAQDYRRFEAAQRVDRKLWR